ncbi:unnamed protein product [Ceratitis capitata]|uniref:(Mediterranean fruit fly) hypothetical protein n=1 Tax=Ceratitis capitata TaxID=7213 RepID=A0A811UD03_CERCA|nr:unnamed protein product [Ceratitis capitata]
MASAHILQYKHNSTRKSATEKPTQTFSTTTATIDEKCFVRYTSGTPEACCVTNERKQFTDQPSATAYNGTTSTDTDTATVTATVTATHLSTQRLPNTLLAVKSDTKRLFNGTAKKVHQPTDDILLQIQIQQQGSSNFSTLQANIANKVDCTFFATTSSWKQATAPKRPSSSQPPPLVWPNQKCCQQEADDVVCKYHSVDCRRRGRSKSESAILEELHKQRQQQQQQEEQQRRWHSESSGAVLPCEGIIAGMSSAAISNVDGDSEWQQPEKCRQEQICHDIADFDVGVTEGSGKMSTEICDQQWTQSTTSTGNNNNSNNNYNKTKSCQSNETKEKRKCIAVVAAASQEAGDCDCLDKPPVVQPSSCTRQSSRNANEQQKEPMQRGKQAEANDFKLQFSRQLSLSENPCSFAVPATSQLLRQHPQRAAALCSTFLAAMRSKLLYTLADLQAYSRALLSLIVILNVLPLFSAGYQHCYEDRVKSSFTKQLFYSEFKKCPYSKEYRIQDAL